MLLYYKSLHKSLLSVVGTFTIKPTIQASKGKSSSSSADQTDHADQTEQVQIMQERCRSCRRDLYQANDAWEIQIKADQVNIKAYQIIYYNYEWKKQFKIYNIYLNNKITLKYIMYKKI